MQKLKKGQIWLTNKKALFLIVEHDNQLCGCLLSSNIKRVEDRNVENRISDGLTTTEETEEHLFTAYSSEYIGDMSDFSNAIMRAYT